MAVKDHGLPQNCGSIYVAYYMAQMSFYGRLMSGSADSIGMCIAYELAAIVSELMVSIELLRGKTPWMSYTDPIRRVCGLDKRTPRDPSAVTPVAGGAGEEEASEGDEGEEDVVEAARHRFCADLVHTLSISEAYERTSEAHRAPSTGLHGHHH